MKAIKTVGMGLLALGVFALSACDRHSTKEVYYLIATNMNLPYWQTAADGFNKAAAQLKVTAKVDGPASYDPAAEKEALHKAIAAHPAGILISSADAAVLQPEIDAGIPVITMESDAPGSRRLYFIGTNNLEAGRLGGKRVIEKLGGKGNVAFFTLGGQANTEERLKGFKDIFSTRPGINVVEVVDTKGDARNAFDKAQEMMAQTGAKKIDAFICLEAAGGKQVAEAVKRGGGGRLVLAWDVDQETLDEIKTGTIEATIAQKPYTMGYFGLNALDGIFHNPPKQLGKDSQTDAFAVFPAFVDTGAALVDKSNVDLYTAAQANSH
jgi:ribose transport system substrate-binding protein